MRTILDLKEDMAVNDLADDYYNKIIREMDHYLTKYNAIPNDNNRKEIALYLLNTIKNKQGELTVDLAVQHLLPFLEKDEP